MILVFSHLKKFFYIGSFYFIFYASVIIAAQNEGFVISGLGAARIRSIKSIIVDIQRLKDSGNPIAIRAIGNTPINSLKEKEAIIAEYNRLLEENKKAVARGYSPLKPSETLRDKEIAKSNREAAQAAADLENSRKIQAIEVAKAETLRMENEKLQKRLAEETAAKEKHAVALNLEKQRERATPLKQKVAKLEAEVAQVPHLKKSLEDAFNKVAETDQKLAETEKREAALKEEINKIRTQLGGDVLDSFLQGSSGSLGSTSAAAGQDSEDDALKLELASYYAKIKRINKKLGDTAQIIADYKAVEALLQEIETEIISDRSIKTEKLKDALELMEQAHEIAQNYRKSSYQGLQTKINAEQEPQKRATYLKKVFEDYYLEPIRIRKEAIEASDPLQLSLQITLNFEASILLTKESHLFSANDFTNIDRTISRAINEFRAEIMKQDREIYKGYLDIIEQEKGIIDFSSCPMTLHLLRDPMVLFMLKGPKKEGESNLGIKFASFDRVIEEMRYLDENQKKALFALFYQVVLNYDETSKKYLQQTLLSTTPIKQDDIHPLIKGMKEALKQNHQPTTFTPSEDERKSLKRFSQEVEELLSGGTYLKALTTRYSSSLTNLVQKIDGISKEAIDQYLADQTSNLEKATDHEIINKLKSMYDFISKEGIYIQSDKQKKMLTTYETQLVELKKMESKLDPLKAKDAGIIKNLETLPTTIASTKEIIDSLTTQLNGFIPEIQIISGDTNTIESRGNELFDFNEALDSSHQVLTALQMTTRKLAMPEAENTADADTPTNKRTQPGKNVAGMFNHASAKVISDGIARNTGNASVPATDPLAALKAKKKAKEAAEKATPEQVNPEPVPAPPQRPSMFAELAARFKKVKIDA